MKKVEFYSTPAEKSPIEVFLGGCNPVQETKILRQLQYVQEFGLTPAVPNLKKIVGTPLWELRILGKDNIRIFCAQTSKDVILLLHICFKKKKKIPEREISLAIKRYREILDK